MKNIDGQLRFFEQRIFRVQFLLVKFITFALFDIHVIAYFFLKLVDNSLSAGLGRKKLILVIVLSRVGRIKLKSFLRKLFTNIIVNIFR